MKAVHGRPLTICALPGVPLHVTRFSQLCAGVGEGGRGVLNISCPLLTLSKSDTERTSIETPPTILCKAFSEDEISARRSLWRREGGMAAVKMCLRIRRGPLTHSGPFLLLLSKFTTICTPHSTVIHSTCPLSLGLSLCFMGRGTAHDDK